MLQSLFLRSIHHPRQVLLPAPPRWAGGAGRECPPVDVAVARVVGQKSPQPVVTMASEACTTSTVTLGLAVGDGDAAFGEGLADFGVDLIGGYGAGGAGVDPMRCLASAAAMWTGWRCGRRRTARKQRGDPDRASAPHGES